MIFSGEHLLIFAVVLLFFGPRLLPHAGATLGKAVRNFKDSLSGVKEPAYKKLGERILTAEEVREDQA